METTITTLVLRMTTAPTRCDTCPRVLPANFRGYAINNGPTLCATCAHERLHPGL